MLLLPLILFLVHQAVLICGKHIAIDESIAQSMCGQMSKFQQTSQLQPEVKEKHPDLHGCAWIHWKSCSDPGRDCPSTFERQQLDKCPGASGDESQTGSGNTGGSSPAGGAPGGTKPGGGAPVGTTPGGGAPGGTTPGSGAPVGTTPGGGAPGGTTPGGGAPGGTTPGVTAPGGTTPGGGAPATSAPGSGNPGSGPGSPGGGGGAPAPGGDLPDDAMKVSMDVDGNQRCYILDSSAKLKLQAARALCQQRGGSLLSLKSMAENAIIEAILGAHAGHTDDEYWTDLDMSSKPYKWKTADVEMAYTDPSFKESGDAKCLAVSVPFGAKAINWSSKSCDADFYAMCELEGGCDIKAPTQPQKPSQPVGLGVVTMSAEIDEEPCCYTVDPTSQKTKPEAEAHCKEKLGGNLVAIESQMEQIIIESSMNSNGLSTGGYWTSANLKENKWASTGQSIDYKYDQFKANGQECMTLNPTGTIAEWTGVDCGGKQFAFCEKHGPCSGSAPPPPPPTGGPPIPSSGRPPIAPATTPPANPSGSPPIPPSSPAPTVVTLVATNLPTPSLTTAPTAPLSNPSGPPATPTTTPRPGTQSGPADPTNGPGSVSHCNSLPSLATTIPERPSTNPPPKPGTSPAATLGVVSGPTASVGIIRPTASLGVVRSTATLGVVGAPTATLGVVEAPTKSVGIVRPTASLGVVRSTATLGVVGSPTKSVGIVRPTASLGVVRTTAQPPVVPPPPAGPANQSPDDGTWLTMSIGVDGTNVCYALQASQKTTAEEATSICQKNGRGDLVSIETKYENVILESFMYSSQVGSDGFWTSADLSTRKWKSTGLEFEYKDPSIEGQQTGQCVTLKLTGGVIGWHSTSCTETHYALCERKGDCSAQDQPPPPKASIIPTGVARLNAEYNGKTSCYTVSNAASATMQEAEAICSKEGYGKLVAIETQEEHEILNALLRSVRLTVAPSDLGYWTSADLSVDSAFKWRSIDKPFSYTHDDFIKTSGLGCMTLLVKEVGTWWVSLKCEDKQHVLCEMDSDCKYEGDTIRPPPPPVGNPGGSGLDDDLIHIEGSLSRSICKQMKAFKETKKLQPELKDKYEHAGGDDDCNWYQWEKCAAGEKCAKFNPFACNREGLVGESLVHIDSSLSKSICKQMKDYQQTKKIQPELKDKLDFAAGDKECSWYHWQKCQDGENCAKFDPRNCKKVPEPS